MVFYSKHSYRLYYFYPKNCCIAMIKKLSDFEKMILLSISFTIALVAVRFLYTNDEQYFFYPWNLFLATVPCFFSKQLRNCRKLNMKVILLLLCWLLFLPNAPYIITDL